MRYGLGVTVLLFLIAFQSGSPVLAQSALGAPPSWVATAIFLPAPDPKGAAHAPEMDILAKGFLTGRKSGDLFLREGRWQFGYRSSDGVIAVFEQENSANGRILLGGIDTGLDRLISVSLSNPGAFFPGFQCALIWSGFDAAGVQKIGACPFQPSSFDESFVVNVPVASPSGGVWVHASFLGDGIALIDGVNSTVRWLDSGLNLHPEIAVAIPIDLRYETTGIVVNSEGEIELRAQPSMGIVLNKRVINATRNRVVRVQVWPPEPLPETAIDDPVAIRPVAGATLVQAMVEILPSATGLVVEAAPTADGPWVAISSPEKRPPSEFSVLIPLNRSLSENEWIRIRDRGAKLIGGKRQVGAAQVVFYQESLVYSPVVERGTMVTLMGVNLAHGGKAPVVNSAVGPWTVVSHSATSLTVEAPASHPAGKAKLLVNNALGSATVEVIVQ